METLLENLIRVNGQQGGTIHQFIGNNIFPNWSKWEAFEKAYYDLRKCNIEFPSKASFDKLAKEYKVKIQW